MKYIVGLIVLHMSIVVSAQSDPTSDSLKKLINTTSAIDEKIRLLVDLGEHYSLEKSDSLYALSEDLIAMADKEDDHCNKAIGFHYKANYFYQNGEYHEALDIYKQSLDIRQKFCPIEKVAASYIMIGNVNHVLGNYDEASKAYYISLSMYESLNDLSSMSAVHANLGLVDDSREKYEDAMEHYQTALELEHKAETPDLENLGNVYNNIGAIYEDKEAYDTAVYYFQKAMDIYTEAGNKSGLAHGYNNIGIIYYYQGYPDSCLYYFTKSMNIRKALGDNRSVSQSYNNIGILYQLEGDYNEGIAYSDTALQIGLKHHLREEIRDAYLNLYELNYAKGDYLNATNSLKMYADYKDSLTSESSERTLSVLEAKYENTKKEKEIQLKDATLAKTALELKRKNDIIWAAVIAGGLLIALLIVIFNRNKITKRQNKIINEQKNLVEQKQVEIIDSIKYAKRIQDALLKSEERESSHLPDHFIMFRPKDIVSGDFYWVHERDHYLYMAVADCTGHGVPGAFLTMLGSSFLNEIMTTEKLLTPGDILNELRARIVKELSQTEEWGGNKDGLDISLARLDLKTRKLMWAGANNPLWIVRERDEITDKDKEVFDVYENMLALKGDKRPVGQYWIMDPFNNHEVQLKPADVFYLFSDGYPDQFGGDKGKKFNYKTFKDLLISLQGLEMAERKSKVNEVFDQWKGSFEQIDDVCVMGVRV